MRIKRFNELFEEKTDLSIRKDEIDSNAYEYTWMLDGVNVGEMMVFVEGKDASIVGFFKQQSKNVPRGYGYRFIKMCIDSLLDDGFSVHQADHTSNDNSKEVWRKLANDYKVETTTWRGDPAKVIRYIK